MELWIALWLLLVLQCLVWLPADAVAFLPVPGGSWLPVAGPGWALLVGAPCRAVRAGAGLPLCEREGRLHGRAARGPSGAGPGAGTDVAALAEAQARGRVVRVGGRPFARALTPERAASLADLLRALGRAPDEARPGIAGAAQDATLSLGACREAARRVGRATRWLRVASGVYGGLLLAALPAASAVWGTERVLSLAWPGVAALHLAALVALGASHARLYPGRLGERMELLLGAALYPPALLRSRHDLHLRALAPFHPATVAGATLPAEEARAWLRAEILRAASRAEARPEGALGLDAREQRALWRLAEALGESAASLFEAPSPVDPLARSYCPACRCEYRCHVGSCNDCHLALVPWPGRAAPRVRNA